MSGYQYLDPSQDDDWTAWQSYRQRQDDFASNVANPELGLTMSHLAAYYPTMQPGVLLALGRAGVKPGDKMAEDAMQMSSEAAKKKVVDKPWWKDMFNATVRGTMTAAEYPFQEMAGVARTVHKAVEKHGVAGAFTAPFTDPEISVGAVNDQTNLGQIANAVQEGRPVDTGSGYFVNPEKGIGKAQADAARQAWTVDGHAATLGRVAAGTIFQPDSKPYDWMSGAIDFSANLALDPTNVAGGEVSKLRKANKLFQPTSGRNESALSGRTGQLLSAGLIKANQPTVASDIATQWVQSRAGRNVSERIALMKSPTDIRNAMKKKIDIEDARALADADTPEAVQDIIIRGAAQGRIREKPYTGGMASWKPVQQLGYEVKRKAENVRLLGALPGEKFMLTDGTQAVDQLDATLKNANMGVDETRRWTDSLARADTPEQRRTIIFDALADMGNVLSKTADPKKVKANARARDINGEEYGTVTSINKAKGTANLRYHDGSQASIALSNLVHEADDAAGQALTGLTHLYRKTTEDFNAYNLDDVGKEKGIEGLTINDEGVSIPQPLLFSQLTHEAMPGLSREDILEIRRMTAGLGLDRLLTSGAWKGTASAAKVVGSAWRNLTLLRGAYTLRVVGEEQLRLAANGLDSAFSYHPLSAIAYAVGAKGSRDYDSRFSAINKAREAMDTHGRGTTDAWGRDWEQQVEEEGEFNKFQQAHMQRHADKRWAINTNFDGWLRVNKGDQKYAAGWSRELVQLHKDPLAMRLAGGWREGDDVARTGNDIADAKEWFWNGGGREYRMAHAERGGKWSNLAEDKELSDTYVEAIHDMVTHKVADDPELRDLVARGMIGDKPAARQSVEQMLQAKASRGQGPEMVRAHATDIAPEKKGRYRSAVDHSFDLLLTRPSNYLSRSSTFRQYYWQRMSEMMPSLNDYAQAEVLKNAREANLGKEVLTTLYEAQKKGKGDLSLEETDMLSKSFALDSTKKLLYDLGERGQFFDQARIVMPFGEAWKEAIQTWTKAFSESPHQLYRVKQAVEGGEGSGFFYTDENGNRVFNYPLTAQMSQWSNGTFTPLKGQVAGLNLIGNGLPGVGPVIQVAAAQLLKHQPNAPDFLRQALLPTGDPDTSNGMIEAFFPGWAKRLTTAAMGDPDEGAFGNTVGRIMQHKMSTGKYNLNTPEGMQKLEKDSIRSARKMYVFRSAAQFVAPTAPSPEWMAKDKDGRMWTAAKLMQDYRDLQNTPSIGYEGADEAFLARYGENALLYMQPLSEGGFAPTTDLHKWVKDHPDVANEFRDVYGFFAGQAGAYSSLEYERQVSLGEREKLSPREILELGNNRVARLQYEQARTLVGDKPNAAGKEFLASVKAGLKEKYPGYDPDSFGGSKGRQYKIDQIRLALSTKPELNATEVGKAATKYLELRDAIESAMPGYRTTKQGAGARAAMREYGSALAVSTPDFSRMWDLLEGELKNDDTEAN